jgi:hypothetical protein
LACEIIAGTGIGIIPGAKFWHQLIFPWLYPKKKKVMHISQNLLWLGHKLNSAQ